MLYGPLCIQKGQYQEDGKYFASYLSNWQLTMFISSQKYAGLIVLQSCLQKGKVVTFKRHCGEDITKFICTLSVLASLNWHYGGAGHDADSFLSRDVFQTHER